MADNKNHRHFAVHFHKNGNWLRKEKFTDTKAIGVHLDINGKKVETDAGMIVYSKTGTHVYPRKEIK